MKIAIISSTTHNHIGGTETYARLLIEALKDKNEITEFPIQEGVQKVAPLDAAVKIDKRLIGWKPGDMVWGGTYTRKNMGYIYSEFDVVIINNTLPPKRYVKNKKTILIQHFDIKAYSFFGNHFAVALGGLFSNLFFGVGGTIGNIFKKASNVVFYDESTSCEIGGSETFIPLPSFKQKYTTKKRKDFMWLGRLENKQKNVKMAINIANETGKLDIYGDGPYKRKLLTSINDRTSYKGYLKATEVQKTMKNYEALIMTSNYEGFSFILVEALHSGLPVIALNNFDSLKFFNKSGAVELVESEKELLAVIKSFNGVDKSKLAFDFAQRELSVAVFNNSWIELINKFR